MGFAYAAGCKPAARAGPAVTETLQHFDTITSFHMES